MTLSHIVIQAFSNDSGDDTWEAVSACATDVVAMFYRIAINFELLSSSPPAIAFMIAMEHLTLTLIVAVGRCEVTGADVCLDWIDEVLGAPNDSASGFPQFCVIFLFQTFFFIPFDTDRGFAESLEHSQCQLLKAKKALF
jgi:hypothetical protein